MADVQNAELELQYKSCYARILDAKRRFLEAATRYYDLSQSSSGVADGPKVSCPKSCMHQLKLCYYLLPFGVTGCLMGLRKDPFMSYFITLGASMEHNQDVGKRQGAYFLADPIRCYKDGLLHAGRRGGAGSCADISSHMLHPGGSRPTAFACAGESVQGRAMFPPTSVPILGKGLPGADTAETRGDGNSLHSIE